MHINTIHNRTLPSHTCMCCFSVTLSLYASLSFVFVPGCWMLQVKRCWHERWPIKRTPPSFVLLAVNSFKSMLVVVACLLVDQGKCVCVCMWCVYVCYMYERMDGELMNRILLGWIVMMIGTWVKVLVWCANSFKWLGHSSRFLFVAPFCSLVFVFCV